MSEGFARTNVGGTQPHDQGIGQRLGIEAMVDGQGAPIPHNKICSLLLGGRSSPAEPSSRRTLDPGFFSDEARRSNFDVLFAKLARLLNLRRAKSMLLGGRVVLRLVAARILGFGPSRLRLLLANTR
jgi:hypothetical protein